MAINPTDLFNKYKNLLSGAGKSLSNMIPAVGAYKAVKQIATPQFKPQLLSSVQQINKRLPMGINIPTSRQGLQQNVDRSLGITPQVKLAEQKMLNRKRLNPEEQKLVTGQAMDFALNFMGGSPEGVIGASLKSARSAQALKKFLPEIRSIKNLIENVKYPDIMQQRDIDAAFTKFAPKNLSSKMKKILNNPKERIEYMRSLLPALEDQALNPNINIGTNIKSIRGDVPTQVSKGVKVKPLIQSKQSQIKPKQVSPLKVSSEVPQIQKATKSLEQEATLKQSKVSQSVALPDIVSRQSIDVKSKVGLLDYLRTPDRVLKKIGMEKESNLIRQKYDDYLKQLPQEIDKVTAWSKQVSKDGNRRIFQYLDGQPVQLEKNELKVANEIKSYLAEWANKLKLPKEKRISNYITHIFEKDFIKKEFDPDFAKLIQDRVAGSVYDPFTEQRLGKLGYVEDTWRALDAYVKRATRKVNMDVALEQVKDKAANLEISQFNYVKKYIDRINLRPTDIDNLVDNTIKQMVGYKFGQRPTAVLTRAGRQMVYRGTLGLNPGTALKNLTQGANTYAKLGERFTIKGYWDTFIKGTKELQEVGVLRDNFIQDRTISAGKQMMQKFDKGLFVFFDAAEKINRGAAYYGAKARALSKGLSEQEAIQEGLKMVRDTQFTFGSIDTPPILSSDIGKLLLQFQSYSLKQGEFLGEMIAKKEFAGLIRYALAGLGMVYSVGKLIGMKPKDLIPSFRLGLPPTIQTPIEIGKAIVGAKDEWGNEPEPMDRLKNVGESLVPFIPAGTQIKKTIQGLTDVNQGYSESSSGGVRYPVEQSTDNTVRGGLFGRHNLPEAREYYEKKRTPLGEQQSQVFKNLGNLGKQYYDKTMAEREKESTVSTSSNIDEKTAEERVRLTGELQNVNGKVFYPDPSVKDGVSSVQMDRKIEKPKLSGQTELDKKRISKYKSQLTAKANDVYTLNEIGVLTNEQAEMALKEIEKLRLATTTKKPKKITIKAPKMPKVKLAKVKTKKVKLPKPKKVKKYSLKKIKLRKVKLSAKLV